jgi:transposase
MSRNINYTLTEEELVEVEQAINSSPHPEVRQRAIAVRLLHLGQSPQQVAEGVIVTSNTIYAWHKRWREQGCRMVTEPVVQQKPIKPIAKN